MGGAVRDDGEGAHGVEERPVGETAAVQRRGGVGGEEEAAEWGEGEVGAAGGVGECRDDETVGLPEVVVGVAAAALGEAAEPGGGVPAVVALAGVGFRVGVGEELAVLGDEEDQEAVHDPEELAVVVLPVELAAAEGFAQGGVRRMRQESAAEGRDGGLDAAAELVEGAGAFGAGGGEPAFQPAVVPPARGGLEAGLVGEHPEEDEVGVDLALEEGLEVELDVGLAGEADVVAQEAQDAAVAHDPPEPGVVAVQEFLDEGVRAGAGGTGHAF